MTMWPRLVFAFLCFAVALGACTRFVRDDHAAPVAAPPPVIVRVPADPVIVPAKPKCKVIPAAWLGTRTPAEGNVREVFTTNRMRGAQVTKLSQQLDNIAQALRDNPCIQLTK